VETRVDDRPDDWLVASARDGDVESFGELYRRHYCGVVGVAYSVLFDRHLAEDAAQETFAVACRDLGRLKHPDRFAAWLRGICSNVAKGIARSRARWPTQQAVSAPAREGGNPGHAIEQAVRRAVAQLRPPAREVVVLHYFSGLSHKQAAAALGISPEAVHGRLVRARRQVSAYLRRNGVGGRSP